MMVDEVEQALLVQWDRICAEWLAHGVGELSHEDQVFYWIWILQGEVDNGGFAQYMFNSTGDDALAATAALREVGAEHLADVCDRFFALLPGGRPALGPHFRQVQLDEAAARLGQDQLESACDGLHAEFRAGEDELRRRLLKYIQGDDPPA